MRSNPFSMVLFIAILHSTPADADTWTGKVVGVSDGDTITVLRGKRSVKILLHGVDCPEKAQPYSSKAKQFTSEMVFGKQVKIEVITKDRYGQTVGKVNVSRITLSVKHDGRHRMIKTKEGWVDDPSSGQAMTGKRVEVCVNEELVKAGLAWWYRRYAPKNATLARLEAEAKRAKRGLWADKSPIAPWDWQGQAIQPELPRLAWSKDRVCRKHGDCAFLPNWCPNFCPPCTATWRQVANREAVKRFKARRAKSGPCPVAGCKPCSRQRNWLGTKAVCVKGQCAVRP